MSRRTEVTGGRTNQQEGLTAGRPLRRDAEQNLARVVSAARDVFAEHGYEASMEQIALRADVGIGTLYRRFPNKADLFAAVVDAATERTRMIADEVLAGVAPADAVFEFVRRCIAAPSCWRAMTSPRPWNEGREERALASLLPVIGQILTASQRAGSARDDISPTDVVVLLMSVRAVADLCDADAPGASLRFLDLALDGMRPSQTPPTHPPVTPKQLGRVLTTRQNPPASA
jgi:AcrR family transcriptional regulator